MASRQTGKMEQSMKRSFLVLICVFYISSAFAQTVELPFRSRKTGELIYSVFIDKTWISDFDLAHRNGMDGFFYPSKYNLETSPIGIMTASIVTNKSMYSFDSFVKSDLENFAGSYGSFEKEELILPEKKNVMNTKTYKIVLRDITQYISYYETSKAFIVIICQIFEPSDQYFEFFRLFLGNIQFE